MTPDTDARDKELIAAYREILACGMENREGLSNPEMAKLLRDKSWKPAKDSLWTMVLDCMAKAHALEARMNCRRSSEVEQCASNASVEGSIPSVCSTQPAPDIEARLEEEIEPILKKSGWPHPSYIMRTALGRDFMTVAKHAYALGLAQSPSQEPREVTNDDVKAFRDFVLIQGKSWENCGLETTRAALTAYEKHRSGK